MLIFRNKTLNKIYSNAEAEYPRECCGIILGRQINGEKAAYSIIEAENTAPVGRAETYFQIDPLEIARAERTAEAENLEIVGFYHSHIECTAFPSAEDTRHMIAGLSYPIVSVIGGSAVSVRSYEKASQTDAHPIEEDLSEEW